MDQQKIILVAFGNFEEPLLRKVAGAVSMELKLPVSVRHGHLDLSDYYDPARRQYNGDRLLKTVDTMYAADSFRTMGLFTVDIFIPILTYIFGQAFLRGRTGIASLYRLSNERYGMEPDEDLMLDRFIKEVIHELGHTLGLIHCHVPTCVMRSVTYVEDIDQKQYAFCSDCRKKL